MLFVVDFVGDVSSISVSSLGVFWNWLTSVGLYFSLLVCVVCGVSMGVLFFLIFTST